MALKPGKYVSIGQLPKVAHLQKPRPEQAVEVSMEAHDQVALRCDLHAGIGDTPGTVILLYMHHALAIQDVRLYLCTVEAQGMAAASPCKP